MSEYTKLQAELNVPLGDTQDANVQVEFGAGLLNIDGEGVDTGVLASGTLEYFEGQNEPERIVMPGPTLGLTIRQDFTRGSTTFYNAPNDPLRWNIHLNPQVPIRLSVKTGASTGYLNLGQLRITDLSVDVGASDARVLFPAQAGNARASVRGGAASLNLAIPVGVEARIRVSSGLASVTVAERFRRQGEFYVSDGYGSGPNNLDLTVEVGVSSVTIS